MTTTTCPYLGYFGSALYSHLIKNSHLFTIRIDMSFGYEPNGHEGLTLWSHQFDRVSKCACFGRSEFDEYARTNGIFFPARCFAVDHMRMEKEFEMRHRKTQMDLFHCQTISRTGVPIFKKQQSFPQFALLPMEIQQLIWKFSLPGK